MAKNAVVEPETVSVAYDLNELPTAQHKAGLAGLLLQISSMKDRGKTVPECSVSSGGTLATIQFTKATTQSVFDDLYDGSIAPEWFPQKKAKEHLLDERTVERGEQKVRQFSYDVVRPSLHTIAHFAAGVSGTALVKLWQDMLWGVPRGVNTNRIPFEVVAGWNRRLPKDQRRVAKAPSAKGEEIWKALCNFQANTSKTFPIKGDLLLGSQEHNAELIAFDSREEQSILLHFWHLASLVFVPQSLKFKLRQGRLQVQRKNDGFAIAIPDVADLNGYVKRFRTMLQRWAGDPVPQFGRPPSHIVEIAFEGAISLADREHQASIGGLTASSSELRRSMAGVDFLHFKTSKNGARLVGTGKLPMSDRFLLRCRRDLGDYSASANRMNPLFRRGVLRALLDDSPWFVPFGKLFAEYPAELFVPSERSPRHWWFWADARRKLSQETSKMRDSADDPPDDNARLATAVNRFVRKYLDDRLAKENPSWDVAQFRKNRKTPKEAAEARQKLAERLFLEFRSRSDQAFAAHFSGTFFRVPQYVGRDFEYVAKQLIEYTDNVKTLALMALSSNSWSPASKKENAE